MAASLARRHVGHAATAGGGRHMPPGPMAICPTTGVAHAAIGPGGMCLRSCDGMCHVSSGKTCRHLTVILFNKLFERWFFLIKHWRRWSIMSKIRGHASCIWTNMCAHSPLLK
jgi:hypothetical protein